MFFRQIYDEGLAQAAYLIGCQKTGEAIVIDPARDVECGHVGVLEDRSQPEGALVRLPAMIARTRNPDPAPDPVIYLAGGGGHNHLRYSGFLQESVGDVVLEVRDNGPGISEEHSEKVFERMFTTKLARQPSMASRSSSSSGSPSLVWGSSSMPLTIAWFTKASYTV